MGGFYGSVQIQGADREAIKSVVETLAGKMGPRFLIGPELCGWTGVYPAGNGQNVEIGREVARELKAELFHLLVHDDDIFIYDYYRDGKLVDRYNSRPDYFEQVSASEARELRGRPETFAHLASADGIRELNEMLADPDAESFAFASALLERFAQILGIRNAVTSYEYLQNGELDGLEGWDQFVHVPDLSSEKEQERRAEELVQTQKHDLMRKGLLLAEAGGMKGRHGPTPWWCPAPDRSGFLLAWSDHTATKASTISLDRYGPPWPPGSTSTSLAIDPHIYGLTLSPSGRFLGVAHAAGEWKATLWDLVKNRRLATVPQVRAVTSVNFSYDDKSMISVSSHGEEGRVVITPVDGGANRVIPLSQAKLAAMHPDGAKLVIADNRHRLTVVDVATLKPKQTLWVGGRKVKSEVERSLMAQARQAVSQVDYDQLEKQMRKQQEQTFKLFSPNQLPPGASSIEEFREQMSQQMTLQIRQMREENARIGTPEWEAERETGSAIVFRMMFDASGEWLCLGTSNGAWAYPWKDVVNASEDLPRPELVVHAGSKFVETDHGPTQQGDYVYALDYDPDRGRFLFGGLEGRVRYLEPRGGRSGVLLEPPTLWPINHLGLSLDRSTIGLTLQPDYYSNALYKAGPVVQFWNYQMLSERG